MLGSRLSLVAREWLEQARTLAAPSYYTRRKLSWYFQIAALPQGYAV
jgi:hypothetical protein